MDSFFGTGMGQFGGLGNYNQGSIVSPVNMPDKTTGGAGSMYGPVTVTQRAVAPSALSAGMATSTSSRNPIRAPQIGLVNQNTAGQIAGYDAKNRQMMVDRAAVDAKTQQENMLAAAERKAAEMGRKFSVNPSARIQAAANIAGQMTRAGEAADEQTFQRQMARAQLHGQDANRALDVARANAQMQMEADRANESSALDWARLAQSQQQAGTGSDLAWARYNAEQKARADEAREVRQGQPRRTIGGLSPMGMYTTPRAQQANLYNRVDQSLMDFFG